MAASYLTVVRVIVPDYVRDEVKDRWLNLQLAAIADGNRPEGSLQQPFPAFVRWATPCVIRISSREYEIWYEASSKDKNAGTIDFRTDPAKTAGLAKSKTA